MLDITKYHLKCTFTEPVLGAQAQKDVASIYVTAKFAERKHAPDAPEIAVNDDGLPLDELSTLSETLEKSTTAFHKLDGKPILYDNAVKGFFKEAGQVFNGLRGVKNLRSKIDNLLFVYPRQIPLVLPELMEVNPLDPQFREDTVLKFVGDNNVFIKSRIAYFERPLRAMTAQGPRVTLARSESLPAGTWFECELQVYNDTLKEELLLDLLSYGEKKGIGQFRNGSYGRIVSELVKV